MPHFMQTTDDIVSVSFDRFPAAKGAATHISAFASALGEQFERVHLLTVEPLLDAPQWSAKGVIHQPLRVDGGTLFERVISFQTRMWHWWRHRFGALGTRPRFAHFRSIFEGFPIARDKAQFCDRIIYEVNALPSIELKYHYPNVADDRELLAKLREQERVCLEAADRIIVVSEVTRRHLLSRGVDDSKIELIRNGVDLGLFAYHEARDWSSSPPSAEYPIRLLYSGTMSGWQGVAHAIDALALLNRDVPVKLTLVGPARPRQRKFLTELAWRLGVSDHLHWQDAVDQPQLAALHAAHDVVLSPLTRCDRNCDQGCCPLKVLEALSCGTPLVASDLEVVRELCRNDEHALLVKPNSGKSIKDAVLRLVASPGLAQTLSLAGRRHVEQHFDWRRSQAALCDLYRRAATDVRMRDRVYDSGLE